MQRLKQIPARAHQRGTWAASLPPVVLHLPLRAGWDSTAQRALGPLAVSATIRNHSHAPAAARSSPPLPHPIRPTPPPHCSPTAELQRVLSLASRPPAARPKRRPASANGTRGSGGQGWTAYTAFGLEMRAVVRAEAPWATATEVEKVGGGMLRWGGDRLSVHGRKECLFFLAGDACSVGEWVGLGSVRSRSRVKAACVQRAFLLLPEATADSAALPCPHCHPTAAAGGPALGRAI